MIEVFVAFIIVFVIMVRSRDWREKQLQDKKDYRKIVEFKEK